MQRRSLSNDFRVIPVFRLLARFLPTVALRFALLCTGPSLAPGVLNAGFDKLPDLKVYITYVGKTAPSSLVGKRRTLSFRSTRLTRAPGARLRRLIRPKSRSLSSRWFKSAAPSMSACFPKSRRSAPCQRCCW